MSEESDSSLLSASDVLQGVLFTVLLLGILAFLRPGTTAVLVDQPITTPAGGGVFLLVAFVVYMAGTAFFNAIGW